MLKSQNSVLYVAESFFLAVLFEHDQQLSEQPLCLWVYHIVTSAFHKVFKRQAVVIAAAVIGLAGGNAVAEHLNYIFHWHLNTLHTLARIYPVIRPIFKMMAVATLMVKPRLAFAGQLTLGGVRTFCAGVINHARNKFLRGVF